MDTPYIERPAPQNSIIDTHAHYDDEKFVDCLDETLKYVKTNGVDKIINCAVDVNSAKSILHIAEKYDFCRCAFGFHPENLPETQPDFSEMMPYFKTEYAVAVGEIGLDYYWEPETAEHQKRWFAYQLQMANELHLPVIVHDRDAHADTLELLKEYTPKGVVHCFSGSCETAKEILKIGMYIGVGGVSTFKNAKKIREVIDSVPLERILLETDAPYMAPEPYRGKACNSAMIIRVAEKIAEIKNIPLETVLKTTKENAINLFAI